MPTFESDLVLPRPLVEVFDFFSNPANLIRVTPPWMQLKTVQVPQRLQLGSRLVLRTKRWGVSQLLVGEVTAFEPPNRFVDEQRQGLFKTWTHTHRFEEAPKGTRVLDRIDYEPPGGLLGLIIRKRFIERELLRTFEYRKMRLTEMFV